METSANKAKSQQKKDDLQKNVQLKAIFKLQRRRYILFILSLFLLVAAFVYGLMTGSVTVPIADIFTALSGKIDSMEHQIVWNLRLPRLLTGLLVGMCLAVSGALLQGIMRNPLAD